MNAPDPPGAPGRFEINTAELVWPCESVLAALAALLEVFRLAPTLPQVPATAKNHDESSSTRETGGFDPVGSAPESST